MAGGFFRFNGGLQASEASDWIGISSGDLGALLSMPLAEKSVSHPVHFRGRVNYYDPEYRLLWLENDQHAAIYVPTGPNPLPLRTGQYVTIDGMITPNRGLRPDEVSVRVVYEDAPIIPLETRGRINDFDQLTNHVATAKGYVDNQLALDDHHVRLALIVENRPVICWIFAEDPAKIPDWQGRFVRISGLYTGRFDSTHTTSIIEFWVGSSEAVTDLGSMDSLAGFNESETPIAELYKCLPGSEVHLRGRIEARKPGTAIVVKDLTGQVDVRSLQRQRLETGSEVDVYGKVVASNDRWEIESAFYRPVPADGAGTLPAIPVGEKGIESVAQIRELGIAPHDQPRPVVVRGMVAWLDAEADYFILLDRTAGIRVYLDRTSPEELQREKYIEVRGKTRADPTGTAISLNDFVDLGSTTYPVPKPIAVNDALNGSEDGGWVEMRGYVSKIETSGKWRTVIVTTPDGNFGAKFKLPFTFTASAGARIRANGVCETVLDPVSLETKVSVLIPGPQYLAVEEEAPGDLFKIPLRRISDLARIAKNTDLIRVHIAGIVSHVVSGQSVYLEDGNKGLLALGRESQRLSADEHVEAVGVLGKDGARVILRDAVFRQVKEGSAELPIGMVAAPQLEPGYDYRLVRMRGTLIDVFSGPESTRLTLEQGDTIFDAILAQPPASELVHFSIGAGLEVTGIYQLIFDDFRRPRGFQILLRSPADVRVFAPARFWTVRRSLAAAAILGACVILGLAWIVTLRRRVRVQTEEIRLHAEEKSRLEAEVQRAARLESLGRLAGGIAHEFNNILTVITGNISLMKLNPLVAAEEGEQILEVEKGALRARAVAKRLLTFSIGGEPVLRVTDLAGLVRGITEKTVRGAKVECVYSIAPNLDLVTADPEQVAQVVEIVVREAVQAMSEGGTIRIALTNVDVALASPALSAGRYVRTCIADEGDPISPEELQRIFDPFSSTRRDKSGLNLSTAYSIVKKHHGHIEAKSGANSGVIVTFWLPVAKNSGNTAPRFGPVPITEDSPAPRVLLMDDEESIRRISLMVMKRLGLEGVAVGDGSMALKEFSAAKDAGKPFSLLVFDLTVPEGLGGLATIEAIRKTDVHTPAIVCSGYSSDPVMADFAKYGFQAAIAKPYDIADFSVVVKNVIAGQALLHK